MDKRIQEYLDEHRVIITFDADKLAGFDAYDTMKRPRKKKPVLEFLGKKRLGMLPSWNKVLDVPNNIIKNDRKQKLSEYTKYILEQMDVDRGNIDRCGVVIKQFYNTRTKFDLDNVYLKSAFDAMTEYGFWEDDNYTVIEPIMFTGGYDIFPRTEIQVFPITEEYDRDFVLDVMKKELSAK